ncbi:DUF2726 domain-containing protein [Cupriavidus sp. H18C2]|uniref:DUF2726 domain-containing protein n=1 Tax=Cupriavidus sp. H18C2 TaxID=3241602 RepID=UPI003BF7CD11
MKPLFGVALLFIVLVAVLGALKRTKGGRTAQGFRFAPKSPFLRSDEIHLLQRLSVALKDAHVFPQVAMSAFVQHKGRTKAARNLFSQKYVDYLVCERTSMRPLYVIELDGASHRSAEAKKRDAQKNEVLASAGIPIKRYTSKDVDFVVILQDYRSVVSPTPPQKASAALVRDVA